jgi:hypothetical protein
MNISAEEVVQDLGSFQLMDLSDISLNSHFFEALSARPRCFLLIEGEGALETTGCRCHI